jgi:Glycosyl transferase family 2
MSERDTMMSSTDGEREATIDVVINNYNYGRFVADAVASALGQTRPFHSVIVVDDGSTDDSLAHIAPFADRIVLVDKENGGQTSACIAGLARCTADYVWFLDADDYLSEGAIETLTPHLGTRPIKVQFQLVGVDADRTPRDSLFPFYGDNYGSAEMIEDNGTVGFYTCAPTSGNVFARSFLEGCETGLIDPRAAIDGALNLVAPYYGEVLSLNLPLAYYRVHGSNVTQWNKPTVAGLAGEIEALAERWREAEALSGGRARAPDIEAVLFTLERQLMIAALTAPDEVAEASRRFLARIAETRGSRLMRLGEQAWARLMLLPVPGLRERLVVARRTPQGRPWVVNKAIVSAKRLQARLNDHRTRRPAT